MKMSEKGFNLIELVIVLVIIAILAVLVIPSFADQLRKSRRYDATSTLLNIEQAQELYRTNNSTYGTLAQVWNGVGTTPDGRYNLTITNVSGTGYVATATAIGDQANDDEDGVDCTPLTVTVNGLATTRAPAACWQ